MLKEEEPGSLSTMRSRDLMMTESSDANGSEIKREPKSERCIHREGA